MSTLKLFQIPSAMFVLDEPIVSEEDNERLTHYMRHYIVAAADPADALEVLRLDALTEGATLLSADDPVERSRSEVPVNLFRKPFVGRRRGVCWKSGRVFFPAA